MKSLCCVLICLVQAGSAFAQVASTMPMPGNEELRQLLRERVEKEHQSVGLVVGIIEPAGRRVVAYGKPVQESTASVDGNTVFEIGSITKVFTSLLLADMARRHEVALTDPVAALLPAEAAGKPVRMPERNGRKITLEDLATHTSGLPRLPTNLQPKDMANPYADYTVARLYEFLSSYTLPREIGSKYEYSNLGAGLLGHALARRAGMSYEALVQSRITRPLGMESTAITLTPDMQKRFATGYNEQRQSVPAWDVTALAGAGALRSTANDLLRFLAAQLGYTETPLAEAMASMVQVRRPTDVPQLEAALAWQVLTRDGKEIVFHGGGTAGYRSFIGYAPRFRTGVVVLSNTAIGVDDIGMRLLGLPVSVPARPEVTLDPKTLDRYPGRYQLAPGFVLTVTRDGTHIYAQATGQPRAEIFPESAQKFFYRVVDAQLEFVAEATGKVKEVVLTQAGRQIRGPRLEGEAPREHKERKLDARLLDGYTGRFALTPQFVLTITREGEHLYAQATGQPRAEIFAESEREFFYKAVDAQITFQVNAEGKATQLTLHQNGMHIPAQRIE